MIEINMQIEGGNVRIKTKGFGAGNQTEKDKVANILKMITDTLVANGNALVIPNEPSPQISQDYHNRTKRNG